MLATALRVFFLTLSLFHWSLIHFFTKGTIVEWTAAVGQAVKADDVIALIETDKVTIDIKADMDGVITQHFGSV
jgi:2-oxoglutarate dehydrogenase E2 component (dihydrolipoamide succinyltransferase)